MQYALLNNILCKKHLFCNKIKQKTLPRNLIVIMQFSYGNSETAMNLIVRAFTNDIYLIILFIYLKDLFPLLQFLNQLLFLPHFP